MTYEQILLFALLAVVFAFLLWERMRYDLVAFGALIAGVAGGVISSANVPAFLCSRILSIAET